MFCWHKEDMDLNAINYLHDGAKKFWYSIDMDSSKDFEKYAASLWPDKSKACKEFLRHKMCLIHPENLLEKGIKMRKAVHKPGEFMITRGYHAGFNSGFNIAEAVNFALFSWLDKLENAKRCECIADSVRINYEDFKYNLYENHVKGDFVIPNPLLSKLKLEYEEKKKQQQIAIEK
jgi:hypothetical protein